MEFDQAVRQIRSGTHAVINLDRYVDNLKHVHTIAGVDKTLMAVVKANAYGHGAIHCARAAIEAGAGYLGVARIDEALELRRAGIDAPVLVIGPPNNHQVEDAVRQNVQLTVATDASLRAVQSAARRAGVRATIHIKVDTGLRRYGAEPHVAVQLGLLADADDEVQLEGLYTHFSSADEEDLDPTTEQINLFWDTVRRFADAGLTPNHIHFSNSAATIRRLSGTTTMVRAGIVSYGLDPSDEVRAPSQVKQILELRSVLSRVFNLSVGDGVSYNRTFVADNDLSAADVPIGYADGIERHLSNAGWVVVRGETCRILGRVCMDQTVIEVPSNAQEGDPVTILSDGHDGAMTVSDIGRLSNTNTYEPVTRLAARVPRLYTRGGQPIAWTRPLFAEHFVGAR